jgi:membrane-bound lytic murein transglycosylase D
MHMRPRHFPLATVAALSALLLSACASARPRISSESPPAVPSWYTPPAPAAAVSAPQSGADVPVGRLAGAVADTIRVAKPAEVVRRADSVLVVPTDSSAWQSGGAADASTIAPALWDMEVEEHAERTRVAYFANIYSGRQRETFQRALSRQTRFAPVIGDRLRAAGLPQDLIYLALIESYYDPHAYSKAAAVGMWQFMTRTAKAVGLRVDWWVDERRDPIRSTEGAVKHLSSLNDEFGSIFLSAAAYNGGSGRVGRGLTQFARRIEDAEGESKFFALADTRSLRPETRDYVPKMIAAALVAKQPERYGLQVDSLIPIAFDSVLAPRGAPLAAIAKAVEAPLDTIRDLNSHVLRGMVPPGEEMWIRVPVGSAAIFDASYAALDSSDRAALKKVISKKGESITSIARKHGLTAKQLNWYNPKAARLKSGNLVTGQPIQVPTLAVARAARDVPNPSIERYPRRTVRRTPARTAAAAKKPAVPPTSAAAKTSTKR